MASVLNHIPDPDPEEPLETGGSLLLRLEICMSVCANLLISHQPGVQTPNWAYIQDQYYLKLL